MIVPTNITPRTPSPIYPTSSRPLLPLDISTCIRYRGNRYRGCCQRSHRRKADRHRCKTTGSCSTASPWPMFGICPKRKDQSRGRFSVSVDHGVDLVAEQSLQGLSPCRNCSNGGVLGFSEDQLARMSSCAQPHSPVKRLRCGVAGRKSWRRRNNARSA